MSLKQIIGLSLLLILICCEIPHFTKKQINDKIDSTKINYGSTIRIKANLFNFLYLSLHPVYTLITLTTPEEVDSNQ